MTTRALEDGKVMQHNLGDRVAFWTCTSGLPFAHVHLLSVLEAKDLFAPGTLIAAG